MLFGFGFGLGALVASLVWWIHIHGLNATIAALKADAAKIDPKLAPAPAPAPTPPATPPAA